MQTHIALCNVSTSEIFSIYINILGVEFPTLPSTMDVAKYLHGAYLKFRQIVVLANCSIGPKHCSVHQIGMVLSFPSLTSTMDVAQYSF